ncbi:MAG: type I-C CRISPR-associated protein Cas8c/Csd1 [Verrucomicrobiota bacterium]|nr:type I-C CRISPR-associated protein Cas8c/Csd1 [Verrucomicrobiota bacterium]
MMLQALSEYAKRRTVEDETFFDPDFRWENAAWLIEISRCGKLLGLIPLTMKEGKKTIQKRIRRPFTDSNEISVRSPGKVVSYFLCDTAERVLLYQAKKEPTSNSLVLERSRYFLESINKAAALGVAVDILVPLAQFLASESECEATRLRLTESKADPDHNIIFGVEGTDVISHPEVVKYWRNQCQTKRGNSKPNRAVCLVTGKTSDCITTANKIKGIGGQDTILISANEMAFSSYGLDKAENSPISIQSEEEVKAALDDLIQKSKKQGLVFDDTIHLHWTRNPIPIDIIDWIAEPDPEGVRALIDSIKTGRTIYAFDAGAYYALSLSVNGARIVVRDWLETSVPNTEASIAQWFQDLAIIDLDGLQTKIDFSLWGLLSTLVPRKKGKPDFSRIAPQAATELLHSAINGGPLPHTILLAAIRRQQLEPNKIYPARIALIKACLLRSQNRNHTDSMKDKLDLESKDIAYLCGQLFAVICRLQLFALGKVSASIAERTYGGVATRPATTLSPLFTRLPAYYKKANSKFPGSGTNKQKEIETLCVRIEALDGLPKVLRLEEQGRFALGYYCQLAQYRTDRAEAEAASIAETQDDELL